jgi:hypothetical protein
MSYYITHSGRRIYLERVSENDICLQDIAHHLTKICRYGGALGLNQHYSVAQHSYLLPIYASKVGYNKAVQRALLLHDATEAYLGDIVSGLKKLLPDYVALERRLAEIIQNKYSTPINNEVFEIVKELDTRIILDEAKAFMPHHYAHFTDQLKPLLPLGVNPDNELDPFSTYEKFRYIANILDIRD